MLNFNKTVTFLILPRHYSMKAFFKILFICILIFGVSLYITKKSIDNTFDKVHCSQTDDFPVNNLIHRAQEV